MKKPLWEPSPERVQETQMTRWMAYLREKKELDFSDYWSLHQWSVAEPASFWEAFWEFCDIQSSQPYDAVLENADDMLNSSWFRGARLNFAEHMLRYRTDDTAILFCNEGGDERIISYHELAHQVAQIAQALRELGVGPGDRVAGYLPNIPEAIVAMLATVSLGAIWSSTSPDFGYRGVLDRFGQIEPKVLFAADGYYYKGKVIDSLSRLPAIVESIPSIQNVVIASYTKQNSALSLAAKMVSWDDFAVEDPEPLTFAQMPFDHPLYILYSSGTTGIPKCIVHGAGGTLLQHLKEHRLHVDIKAGDVFFYFTTCGWMMWNWLVSGLASGAKLLLFDGSPFHPGPDVLWRLAEKHKMKIFGTSAKYLAALEKAGMKPGEQFDLSALRSVLSTGSPLSEASFEYVYRDIKQDVHLASIAGGTDLISCFVLGNPQLPVYSEEIQCPGLGMNVLAFNDDAQPVTQEKGELVCITPFPCQPIYFWNDPDKARYKSAYFDVYPNIWRHGDFIEVTARKGTIIYGRSDATLNPGGIRIGTAEIYRAIEPLPELLDSLVIGRDIPGNDVEVVLFVKLAEGVEMTDALTKTLKQTIRKETTPRHVPSAVYAIPDIPYTISGKKVELAVRRVVHGLSVPNRDALANPDALEYYKAFQK